MYKRYLDVNVIYVIKSEKAYLLRMGLNGMRRWFPKVACHSVNEEEKDVQTVSIMEYYLQKKVMVGVCIVCGVKTGNSQYVYCKKCYGKKKNEQRFKKGVDKVICVYNDYGNFYDVYPKISKSLQEMRDKILGVVGIEWEWHFVLTLNELSLKEIINKGGFSGAVLSNFLVNTRTINNRNRRFFWKYEEGRKTGRPHYHFLMEFGRNFNKAYVLRKLFPRDFEAGEVDVGRLIDGLRRREKGKKKSDIELLMGLLLRRKWKHGFVFVNQLKGIGWERKKNLIYYVNKDLIKDTGFKYIKPRAGKWGFGKGYDFESVSLFSYKELISIKKCIYNMFTTHENFIKYYDSFGRDGYKFYFRKIREIKKGEYLKIIQ